HLALGRLERAVATLADGTQALDAFVPHGDRLRPPPRDLVLLVHVLGDPPVRPGMRRDAIERFDPALPRAAGLRLHGGIAPTRERGIVRRGREGGGGRGGGRSVLLVEELCAGGGIRFARLPHASANEALEILVGRHRVRPLVRPQAYTPQQRHPAATQRLARCRSGSLPPFASRGPSLGEDR